MNTKIWKISEDNMKIMGRTLTIADPMDPTGQNSIRCLCFSGSYVEFTFTGKKLSCVMESDYAEPEFLTMQCFMAVYVNGEEVHRFPLAGGRHEYALLNLEDELSGVGACDHGTVVACDQSVAEDGTESAVSGHDATPCVVRLMKITEEQYATSWLVELHTEEGAQLSPTPQLARRMEFLGDSITCGYGDEGNKDTVFSTETENCAKAYAVRTATALQADFHLISYSGIGALSRNVEPDINEPLTDILIEQLYTETDFEVAKRNHYGVLAWDPEKFSPQIIVVAIGTNDATYTRDDQERNCDFAVKYRALLMRLHKMHEKAVIICTLGSMDPRLIALEKEIVEELSASFESGIYFHEEKLIDPETSGGDGHPSAKDHEIIAASLVSFIRNTVGMWND